MCGLKLIQYALVMIARIGLEKRPRVAKAMQLAAGVVPKMKKMQIIIERLAEYDEKAFQTERDTPLMEIKEKDWFLLIHNDRFESEGVISERPVCGVLVGVLQYTIEWITGHNHEVEEIECRAVGDPADVFRITKAHQS